MNPFKKYLLYLLKYFHWLFALFILDLLAIFLFWIADLQSFSSLAMTIGYTSLLFFLILFFITIKRESKRNKAFKHFIQNPTMENQTALTQSMSRADTFNIQELGKILRASIQKDNENEAKLENYKEYVETWAHEIKTPISLLTFILDNRKDEFTPATTYKLDYVRTNIQEYVNHMLYYSRTRSKRKDYIFNHVDLYECMEDVLSNYSPLLKEKKFKIHMDKPANGTDYVFTDYRGLNFILSQLVSNTIKYSSQNPTLSITFHKGKEDILTIKDNGIGIKSCDLPHIYDKGFTGSNAHTNKKATGMGLYLARKVAQELNVVLTVTSTWQSGTEVKLHFPHISN